MLLMCRPAGGEPAAPADRVKASSRSGARARRPRARSPAQARPAGPPPATSGPLPLAGWLAGRRRTARARGPAIRAARASGVRAARPSGHSSQRTGWAMLGTVHSRTPPGRSTRAHSASTAAGSGTYSSTLAATTASRLPAANGSARQPAVEPHPADGLLPVGRGGLTQHLRRDVAAGHPVAARRPGAGPAPRCRSRGRAARRRALPAPPTAAGELVKPPGQAAAGRVLARPAAALPSNSAPHPVGPVGPAPGQTQWHGRSGRPPRGPPPRWLAWPAWWRACPRWAASVSPARRRKAAASARCPLS